MKLNVKNLIFPVKIFDEPQSNPKTNNKFQVFESNLILIDSMVDRG